jgi:hypothetical protein
MTQQFSIDFAPGLLEQYADFMDVVRAAATNCGRQHKAVAADMDMSPSELSRRLHDDPADLPFRARDLETFLDATHDTRPIQWLVLKYLSDPDSSSQSAMRELAKLAPTFVALANAAGLTKPRTR